MINVVRKISCVVNQNPECHSHLKKNTINYIHEKHAHVPDKLLLSAMKC